MSGIVAIYNLDGRPAEARFLDRVVEAAAYRGPDGLGKLTSGPVALGYAACHATPQSVDETQPFVGGDGSLLIAFDGRIDNREELLAAMRARQVEPRGCGDAELVICAWRCWGEDTPSKLLGDFAFALWDARSERLICVRDPAGVKPLYYGRDAHTFLAASELHQVLMHPGASEEPNEAMAAAYMCGTLLGREETMFRAILRLPPGEIMIVSRDGISRRRYYELTPGKAIRYRSDDEYAEHFLEIFREAVRCRMVASGAGVAAQLSGGLDSSFIVGVAQALIRDGSCTPDRFETYSLYASGPRADEHAYFQEVIAMWGLNANIVEPEELDAGRCAALVAHYRDFAEYPNSAPFRLMGEQAGAKGFRVMLSGLGGDDWLQGTDDYCADLLVGMRLRDLVKTLRLLACRATDKPTVRRALMLFAGHAVTPLLPLSLQKEIRRATGRGPAVSPCLAPEFIRSVDLIERLEAAIVPRQPGMTFGQRAVYEHFIAPWSAHAFEIADRDFARAGVELRHPFYDRRVIEFLLAIPEEQRCDGLRTKVILRNAGRGLMPETVRQRRSKAEFSSLAVRMTRRMMQDGILNDMALGRLGWIVVPRFRELCDSFVRGTSREKVWIVCNTLLAELWVRGLSSSGKKSQHEHAMARGEPFANLSP